MIERAVIKGTAGLLVEARRRRLIGDLRPMLYQLRDCIKTNYLIFMTVEPASSRLKPAGSRFYIKFLLENQ
jgi:hypothetical protein